MQPKSLLARNFFVYETTEFPADFIHGLIIKNPTIINETSQSVVHAVFDMYRKTGRAVLNFISYKFQEQC